MKKIKQEKLSISDYFHYWKSLHKKYNLLDREIDKKGLTVVGHEGCPLWYNKFFDHFTNLYFQKMLLLFGDIKGKKVLDIGCGGGRWSERLADKGAEVVGIDIGREIIERNKEVLGNKCSYMVMSADDLDFPDETFDLAVSVTVIQHMPCDVQEKAIREISRVVKSQGKVLIIERVGHKALPYTFPHLEEEWIEMFRKNNLFLMAKRKNVFSPLIDLGRGLKDLLQPKRKFNTEPEKAMIKTKMVFAEKVYWTFMRPLVLISYPLGYLCVYLIPQKFVKAKHGSFLFEKKSGK
ncbi:MAG: hypothetical protein A2W05_08380 [Candidatus Schekmanbacteria bacterium RBG_16_38_10]|uniref:Methyltransferase type 11 domain-containing protein n=1 Tax=Candidatus Schekmanbacteria bacterium RBG_16_38_10 TaxID=1817879 RepID=A0A1F7RXP9_9BACT|nr:MAG: hypothetical protein A2W05_08380 [Candidatus Schekmanbacteria bacterium RBG_16_38_10]